MGLKRDHLSLRTCPQAHQACHLPDVGTDVQGCFPRIKQPPNRLSDNEVKNPIMPNRAADCFSGLDFDGFAPWQPHLCLCWGRATECPAQTKESLARTKKELRTAEQVQRIYHVTYTTTISLLA